MNLKETSGGKGVGVGVGGGHGPANKLSPQTGGGGGAGVLVGSGGAVGGRMSKGLRPAPCGRTAGSSRSFRVMIGTSSGLIFFASARLVRGRTSEVSADAND